MRMIADVSEAHVLWGLGWLGWSSVWCCASCSRDDQMLCLGLAIFAIAGFLVGFVLIVMMDSMR